MVNKGGDNFIIVEESKSCKLNWKSYKSGAKTSTIKNGQTSPVLVDLEL